MLKQRRSSGRVIALLQGSAICLLIVGFYLAFNAHPAPSAPTAVDNCRSSPQFVSAVASTPNLALRSDGDELGLALWATDGSAPVYQHPTWDDAGALGALAYDREGNVYAAPTPRLSLADNPPEQAGALWRADTFSGELRRFVTLAGHANERNPFGVLGLAYACDFDTLFAGSVLGSTPSEELGGIVAIHLPDGAQAALLTGMDPMGLLVVRQGNRFTLYAGSARRPEIVALALDAQGRAAGPLTTLLDLADVGATPQERARKLRLVEGHLIVDLVPFTFSLQANASDVAQLRQASWMWDSTNERWIPLRPATRLVAGRSSDGP